MPQGWTPVPEPTTARGWTPVAEEPAAPARGGLTHPLTSIFTKPEQASVASKILGRDVAPKPEDTTSLSDMLGEVKAHPFQTAYGLTGVPSIIEFLKTLKETGPDIASGLVHNPIATLRGGASGVAEGAMEQATPANIALLALGKLKTMRGAKLPSGELPQQTQLQTMLEDLRKPELPETRSLPTTDNITVAGKPAVTGERYAEIVSREQRGGLPSKAAEAVKNVPARTVEDIPKIAEHVDRIANEAGVEAAATAIEKHVLSVTELAAAGRKRYGSARAGKMLQPNQPAKVGAAAIKRLTPDAPAGRLPDSVRETFTEKAYKLRAEELAGETGAAARKAKRAALWGDVQQSAENLRGVTDTAQRAIRNEGDLLSANATAIDEVSRIGEKGAVNPKLVGGIGGGIAGAAYGATQGDTAEDKAQNIVLYGTAGVMLPVVIAHLATSKSPAKSVQNFMFSAKLANPTSVSRAFLGGAGGGLTGAAELLHMGDPRGAAMLKRMFSDGFVKGIGRAIMHPETSAMAGEGFAKDAPGIIGRIYNGVNEPMMRAMMEEGGFSREKAMQYTLAGEPRTPIGKDILSVWNKYFVLKMLGSMFPRVGVQTLEMGLERTPLGLVKPEKLPAMLKGLNEGTAGARRARVAVGTEVGAGAALAGYFGGKQIEEWAKPYIDALGGPQSLTSTSVFAGARELGKGGSFDKAATAGLQEATSNLPFPRYGPTEASKQILSGASFIPSVVGSAARALDPYDRRPNGGFFDRAIKEIPYARERLPVRGAKTNIAGQPPEDRSSPVKRFLTRPNTEGDKFKGIPENVANEITRLGVEINAPSMNPYRTDLSLGKMKIPADLLERAKAERSQYIVPRLQKTMASPGYQKADDAGKKARLKNTITEARSEANIQARATLKAVMKKRGLWKP